MRQAIVPLLCCLALAPCESAAAPLPQLSQLARRHEDAIVRLLSHDGRVLSSGFFIATVGYVVAALPGARVGDGVVVELATGARRRGAVARVQPRGPLAIVAVSAADDDEMFATLPLPLPLPRGASDKAAKRRASERAPPQGWLVALCHDDKGRVMPAAGGLREVAEDGAWLLDLPCGRGAPVLSGDRVVGVTVMARGVTASTGVGIEQVLALSRGLARKRPTELVALPSSAAHAPPAAPRAAR